MAVNHKCSKLNLQPIGCSCSFLLVPSYSDLAGKLGAGVFAAPLLEGIINFGYLGKVKKKQAGAELGQAQMPIGIRL